MENWARLQGAKPFSLPGSFKFLKRLSVIVSAKESSLDFPRVLQKLNGFLVDREIQFAVIGGVGLAAYGIARFTIDLDLLVGHEHQQDLVGYLKKCGYQTLHRSNGYSNHQHADPALARVDVVYVREETRRQIFGAARKLVGPGGSEILVPSPEHLAAMKVVAMKNDSDRTLQDLADIRELMKLPGVDHQAIRATFEKHDLGKRWNDLEMSA